MAENHLYAVDNDPELEPAVPAVEDDDDGDGWLPEEPNRPARAPRKARPRYVVPTDRMKFSMQIDALRTIVTASRNGEVAVDAEAMASMLGISAATAPLNNAFFIDLGLVQRVGKGGYLPTQIAIDFQNKYSFDKAAAAKLLAPAFRGSWFHDAVAQKLELSGPTGGERLIEALAGVARTDDSYSTQYGFCLDWLEYVGLITIDDAGVVSAASDGGTGEPPDGPTDGRQAGPVETSHQLTPATMPRSRPPILSFSFDVSLTAEDLARLSAEQIAELFEGVGKLAALQRIISAE